MVPEGKQLEFIEKVKSNNKYILVEAPAGTGKTFSCIQAVKALCDSNSLESYQKVLVLTFSRNARAQLLKELSTFPLEDDIYKHIDINNYHSFFKKYLDTYRDTIGINKKLCVIDEMDFYEELFSYAADIGVALNDKLNCSVLDDFIVEDGMLKCLNAKSKLRKVKQADIETFEKTAFLFTQTTGKVCFAQFGNLVYRILTRLPEMASAISHDYPVLILDEYQDTNYFQEYFVRSVLRESSGIFFCDRYQMIYEFRGSTIKRIEELESLYPGIVKIEFDEYFRYKNKKDLVKLLTGIRNGEVPDYSSLVNGQLIEVTVDCAKEWREIKNAKSQKMQCTLYCKSVMYRIMSGITKLLQRRKSVAILCRNNMEVDKLVELFFENNFYPKEFTDTKDMILTGKYLKKLLRNIPISEKIADIMTVAVLCSSKKNLFGETIDDVSRLTFESLKRKTKQAYKSVKSLVSICADKCDYKTAVDLIIQILNIAEENDEIICNNIKKFIVQCSKLENATDETIDGVMLQRQYTNSFTNITPGLYITTIHQSKGKEFDCVLVLDVEKIVDDRNLLYVSHSRMKEQLYPVAVKYQGLKYGKEE